MINFSICCDKYENDLMELVRAFEQRGADGFSLDVNYFPIPKGIQIELKSDKLDGFKKIYRYPLETEDEMERKRLEKRYLKEAIYGTVVFLTGISLPYGCLTGIRPTKLYAELGDEAHDKFLREFSVVPKKLALVEKIVEVQKPIRNHSEDEFDLFVFIPFCPTRCAYCSFVSVAIDKQRKLVTPYVDCLLQELELLKEVVRRRKIKIRTVYIGGGTPTSIPVEELDRILAVCATFGAKEFTVEAGRPDTLTAAVVRTLLSRGVTRVSVNPQTFNDDTLLKIGRLHTSAETEAAYKKVKNHFDVNMDLIAALPDETFFDFKKSLDRAVELSPANITVHTLYMKKGSALKQGGYSHSDSAEVEKMVDYAYDTLTATGYQPYYMYRQKYTGANLENVGYAKPDKACVYNIDIMEEDTSILAAGANAISKKWTKSVNLIERNANYKEPLEYVKHFDEVLKKQRAFWLDE